MSSKLYQQGIWLFVFALIAIVIPGCPSTTPVPDGAITDDGGTRPDEKVVQPLTCEKGTACLSVGHPDARACDILLKNDQAIKSVQVNFDETSIGQFKHRDSRLALAFIMQKDSGFSGSSYAVLVKLDDGSGKFELMQATCYDRKGAKIEKPDVKLVIP